MAYLYERLTEYASSEYYGFHMPGHKRSRIIKADALPYEIDITEIEGFDDLHHAAGILKEAQQRAAYIYGAEETHYLINGSTVGLLSAVLGCTRRGDRIIVARNCHKSVYNAVYLNELRPIYIYPEYDPDTEINGEINTKRLEVLLQENEDISAVVITSPTYDGVVSDIERIAEIVHKRNIPLILDEAHGAHLGFHPYFPQNGNQCHADVVIHSIHKTLPAFTQTALLHMNGTRVDRRKIRKYLHMLQSSSPSYVLMAGIDECIRLLCEQGKKLFDDYAALLQNIRRSLGQLENMKLLSAEKYDFSKLVISVKNTALKATGDIFSGRDLYTALLKNYKIQAEMAAGSYVVLMTSPADTEDGMMRLLHALTEIDKKLEYKEEKNADFFKLQMPEQIYTAYETEKEQEKGTQYLPWDLAVGYISAEYAYLYPPGIPMLVPGEKISRQIADQIRLYKEMGFEIQGTENGEQIEVLIHG